MGKHGCLALLQQAVSRLGTVTENSNKNLQEVNFKTGFYMAQSLSGQGEANPAFGLATRADEVGLSCPPGFPSLILQEKVPFLAI